MAKITRTTICLPRLRFLVLAVLLSFSATQLMAQTEKKITLKVNNAPLPQTLTKIEDLSGCKVSFTYDEVQQYRVSVNMKNQPVSTVMQQVLKETPLEYTVKGKFITVYKGSKPFRPQTAESQKGATRAVKGVVRDTDGEVLVGVPVCIGESRVCTVTDADGFYTFPIPTEETTLKFTYVGMKTEYIRIAAGTGTVTRDIVMRSDNQLDDVVVTGYQQIERGRATGSFEVVGPEQLKTVVSTDVVDNLEGIVPGLVVDGNGNLMVRGQATIYAETKPLIVVDGFPMEYGTFNVNPQDIESISILKDAAAASIWGVRAANGVLVISTKKGSKNHKTEVSYNGNVKIGSRFDVESLGLLGSADQIAWEREHFTNSTLMNHIDASGSYYSEAAAIERRFLSGAISESQRDQEYARLAAYDNAKDIEKAFYRSSLLQTHNVTVTGGGNNSSSYLSFNFENRLATLKGNDLNRVGVQWNNMLDVSKQIKLTTGLRANYANQDTYSFSPSDIMPYVRLADEQGNYVNEYRGVSQDMKDELQRVGYQDWSFNRLQDWDLQSNNTKSYNVQANLMLDFTLPWGFTFSTSGMFAVDHYSQEQLYESQSYYARNLFNEFTYNDGVSLTHYLPGGAIMDKAESNSTSYTWRNVLNYSYDKDQWYVSALAGCEMFAIRTKTSADTYYGFDPQAMTFGNGTIDFNTLHQGVPGYNPAYTQTLMYSPMLADVEDRYFSTFFTASTTYDDRYTVFASMRYDKTNLYGCSGKYRDSPTWSVGGKWNISKEKFFNVPAIDRLDYKISYGLSGNVDKSTSPYLIAAAGIDMFSNLTALSILNPENKDLRWEKVYTFNTGFELNMFKNRFKLSVDYYNRTTRDALGETIIDPTLGFNSVLKNTAHICNQGIDLTVGGIPVQTKYFSWNTALTFSYNHNEVTKVLSGQATVNMALAGNALEGKPVDYVMVYRSAPLAADGTPQVQDAEGNIYAYNATASFSVDDLVYLGRFSPKYYGAWTNTIQYKGFDLNFMFTYKFGHKMMMPNISNVNYGQRPYKEFGNRWMKEGDENGTWVPVAAYDQISGMYIQAVNNNDRMVEKGDMIRLKSISLGYDFSHLLSSNNWLKYIYARVSAENLWYWAANRDGLDPDNMGSNGFGPFYGGDQPRYYALTLNLRF